MVIMSPPWGFDSSRDSEASPLCLKLVSYCHCFRAGGKLFSHQVKVQRALSGISRLFLKLLLRRSKIYICFSFKTVI